MFTFSCVQKVNSVVSFIPQPALLYLCDLSLIRLEKWYFHPCPPFNFFLTHSTHRVTVVSSLAMEVVGTAQAVGVEEEATRTGCRPLVAVFEMWIGRAQN